MRRGKITAFVENKCVDDIRHEMGLKIPLNRSTDRLINNGIKQERMEATQEKIDNSSSAVGFICCVVKLSLSYLWLFFIISKIIVLFYWCTNHRCIYCVCFPIGLPTKCCHI